MRTICSAVLLALLGAVTARGASPLILLETVDSAGDVGGYTSIAIDSDHIPYIASASGAGVRFASRTGGVWASENVPGGGRPTSNRSLRFDGAGQPRIVYEGNYANVLATLVEGTWSFTEVSWGYAIWWTANAIDAQGRTRTAYMTSSSGGQYIGEFGTDWAKLADNVFVPTDACVAMEYDSQGVPHVIATLTSGDLVRYWAQPQFEWVTETLPAGLWPALAIDTNGIVHVSYYALPSRDLVYATRTGPGQWQVVPVDTEGDVGKHPSLVIDGAARAHVSYYDATNGDLKYAVSNGAGWDIVTVDATGDVGPWSSLALDGDVAHMSYYDAGAKDLRYARLTGSLTGVGDRPSRPRVSVRAVPNPFNPSTTIEYVVPVRGRVEVTVFDVAGHVVERLVDAEREPGQYHVPYHARTASGVYFARVDVAGQAATTRLVVLK